MGGHNIVVGIATRYGVDGPGIESPEGGGTSRAAHAGADARPAIRTMGTVSPEVMRPEPFAHYPPPCRARLGMCVKGDLYNTA